MIEQILKDYTHEQIIDKLRIDEDYYGEFGQNFLSNSSVGTLIENPADFGKQSGPNINFLIGGAFHTMILEPEKMVNYPVVDATSRRTNVYKEAAAKLGGMALLPKDMVLLEDLKTALVKNKDLHAIIEGAEKEVPMVAELCGEWWKGKADAVNHEHKMIIDLKTTSNIQKFGESAQKFNYDSQAWIYSQLFGYDMAFIVIDKKTKQVGFYDCSPKFYATGREKVVQAVYSYRTNIKGKNNEEFNNSDFLLTNTL